MIDFADELDHEWYLTTDWGQIVILPRCPWLIQHVPSMRKYRIVCENKVYFVFEQEAKRLIYQAKLLRSAQALNNALKQMIKE
jgi:hypothetical protein